MVKLRSWIDGVECSLEYVIVPVSAVEYQALLEDPPRHVADVIWGAPKIEIGLKNKSDDPVVQKKIQEEIDKSVDEPSSGAAAADTALPGEDDGTVV